jgi:endo-1,4-beta-xylanase
MKPLPILLITLILPILSHAETPAALPLWEKGAPGSESRATEPEKTEGSNVCNIHNPTITPFVPAADKSTGTAVIICPGGGHAKPNGSVTVASPPSC